MKRARAGGGRRGGAPPRSAGPGPRGGSALRDALLESAAIPLALLVRHHASIERMARLVTATLARGRTVLLCGNGGSAAEAQHLAAELVGRYLRDRGALAAIALTTDTSILTAVGNDYGFARIFARQIEAIGRRGDLLIAMTTSGRSPNVLAAVDAARARGMKVIGLTGHGGTAFARRCDAALAVPSRSTARIQEAHLLVGHLLCGMAEDAAAPRRRSASPRHRSAERGSSGNR